MPYTSPGTLGPTSSQPNDPTDWGANSGNGFNFNQLADTLGQTLGSFLNFGAQIYAVNNGQPVYTNGGQVQPGYQYQPQQPQGSMNMAPWLIGGGLLLLVLVVLIVLLKK